MRKYVLIAASLLLLGATATVTAARAGLLGGAPTKSSKTTPLKKIPNIAELKQAFNRDQGKVRLVLLLEPG